LSGKDSSPLFHCQVLIQQSAARVLLWSGQIPSCFKMGRAVLFGETIRDLTPREPEIATLGTDHRDLGHRQAAARIPARRRLADALVFRMENYSGDLSINIGWERT
jgi:hypothetical protein